MLVVVGCGRDDFENDPRPPIALEVSVQLGPEGVTVSPGEFGAGLTNFTVVNLSGHPASFTFDGPTSDGTDEIPDNGSTVLKAELDQGDYEASADGTDTEPFDFTVGPERDSAQNDLLLP
jgi:hypothetical protein